MGVTTPKYKCDYLSLSCLGGGDDRTLFVSSEVSKDLPFVHHCYIKDSELHYLVYDHINDIVIDYRSGEYLPKHIFAYKDAAHLSFFDLKSFKVISSLTLSQCSFYAYPEDNLGTFISKTFGEIRLSMNHQHLSQTGYLLNAHRLGNSITASEINKILEITHSALTMLVDKAIESGDNYNAIAYFQHYDTVDRIALAMRNDNPIPIYDVEFFRDVIFADGVLATMSKCREFRRIKGNVIIDRMLGSEYRTDNV
tara:strand:- start:18928 stop:19686 length:759 start_codon:yes stop_codon:yes gene_type:complete